MEPVTKDGEQFMAKHTEGPWHYIEVNQETGSMGMIVKEDDHDWIVGYNVLESRNRFQRAEDNANGRLMAAAPDLLAACEAVLSENNPPAIDMVKAAVTKARKDVK